MSVDIQKSYIYNPKPQIQGAKTKERKKSSRTLPLDCWEKREIEGFLVCVNTQFCTHNLILDDD